VGTDAAPVQREERDGFLEDARVRPCDDSEALLRAIRGKGELFVTVPKTIQLLELQAVL